MNKPMTVHSAATEHPVLEPLTEVSQRSGNDDLALRLLELRAWLSDDLADLEALIDEFIKDGRQSESHCGKRAAAHLLEIPGKRIRPICVLLAARIGGLGMNRSVRNLAVTCELIHAATLLHDDVIDEGDERRGLEAARVVYGNSASILGGDQLFVEGMRLVHEAGEPVLMTRLFDVISEMIAAEALQLERRGRFEPDPSIYLEVLRGKTAALFRWGLEAGGTISGLDPETVATLGRIGITLGIAFQLVDDILDLAEDSAITGKDSFADLEQGKLTWPIIVACERDESLRAELASIVSGQQSFDRSEGAALIERIRATGALDATREFARRQGREAAVEIARLPAGPARDALEVVVATAIDRAR